MKSLLVYLKGYVKESVFAPLFKLLEASFELIVPLVIASINSDSSLANSKAKVGDLITAVDGEDLDTADVLLDKIENGKVGDKLKLELCRINSDYSIDTFTVEATLVEDKGNSNETETTTESQIQGGYDWGDFFGNGY